MRTRADTKNLARRWLGKLTAVTPVRSALALAGRAGLLPEFVWKRLPVTATFAVVTPDGSDFQYTSTAEDVIARALYWRGSGKYFEPATVSTFYQLARNARHFLDIGANIGYYTMLACTANDDLKVTCFEPVPQTRERLIAHIKSNGWEHRCEVRPEAVSNIIGTARLHVPYYPCNAALEPHGCDDGGVVTIEVPVTTVDEVCAEDVDLVKIDVEGSEDKALEGMERLLEKSHPTIIVECMPDGPFQTVQSLLKRFGYVFYHIRDSGPVPIDSIVPDHRHKNRNFLCTVRGDEAPCPDWRETISR